VSKPFEAIFFGTNGSCSFNNGDRQKYGSNTSCTVIKAGDETLIFDAGSGICGLHDLSECSKDRMHLFLSHYHMDHINGLLFFSDIFDPEKKIDIYGSGDVQGIIGEIISPPLSPVGLDSFRAELSYHTIGHGAQIQLSGGVTVRAHSLSHPGNALGYRVEYDGKVFCCCSDVELKNHQNDASLQAFMYGADILVLDSAFADGKVIPGWGHSCPAECAEWALNASAKKLMLYHYAFAMTDNDVEAMEQAARKVFPNTLASADGMRVVIE